ncbi:low temperature requirement protein A [Streptacidiphilus sp. PB12-B1b]|uniref:low temperature requirement protein A n=1 Tax=Streptacidiphilus sp. PB12-B1b TaxID=2705012 RepID=UPI0015FB0A69|nr:low temperature requirement protein A [Streptacidiphilus sp. PB12-B1b]
MSDGSNAATRAGSPLRRMLPRSRGEEHRASTPLELFFDLCFVVAVSQAGSQLAHALAAGHPGKGISGYLLVFFAIWWAWVNFTWFASAYDTDDVAYRVATLVQITGALILAAGVPRLFDGDRAVGVLGYVVMRCALVAQWLRAAHANTGAPRTVALRYACGVSCVQVGWVVLLFLPHGVQTALLPVLIVAELAVPPLAERHERTSWHPEHIAERYGLFTLIVLGESVSAATIAVQSALDEHDALRGLLPIAAGGLLICFAAWWIYFARPVHEYLGSNRQAFLWGYGHYLVLLSAAAIGAGLEVAVEHAVGSSGISARAAAAVVTVPTAVYLFSVWAMHSRYTKRGAAQAVLPTASVAVLAATLVGGAGAVLTAGLLCAATVAVGLSIQYHRDLSG